VTGFDEVTGLLDYPMYVVTAAHDGQAAGCLVGFATQASIDPPRYLVGISTKNYTHRVALNARRLVVHLLDAGSTELARLFGEQTGDDVDKFAKCASRPGPDGAPVLDGAAAWFSGPVLERFAMGDHTGFLIDIDKAEVRRKPPRLLALSDVDGFDPGHDA
jgi:flavin reductase (DIM6/NTAB) family NADH-FMN oxidoreductase RutF